MLTLRGASVVGNWSFLGFPESATLAPLPSFPSSISSRQVSIFGLKMTSYVLVLPNHVIFFPFSTYQKKNFSWTFKILIFVWQIPLAVRVPDPTDPFPPSPRHPPQGPYFFWFDKLLALAIKIRFRKNA